MPQEGLNKEQIPEVGRVSKCDYYQNLPFGASGDHGPNICIEIGARANRRRAESRGLSVRLGNSLHRAESALHV